MLQAVICELRLYADDTCLICMGKDVKTIEDHIEIKQYSKVTFLGCILASNLSDEAMATKALGTINRRLTFCQKNNPNLSKQMHQLLSQN